MDSLIKLAGLALQTDIGRLALVCVITITIMVMVIFIVVIRLVNPKNTETSESIKLLGKMVDINENQNNKLGAIESHTKANVTIHRQVMSVLEDKYMGITESIDGNTRALTALGTQLDADQHKNAEKLSSILLRLDRVSDDVRSIIDLITKDSNHV